MSPSTLKALSILETAALCRGFLFYLYFGETVTRSNFVLWF